MPCPYGHLPISIHSLPKEGDIVKHRICSIFVISIHSLPKEGDAELQPVTTSERRISIHSLPKEGD